MATHVFNMGNEGPMDFRDSKSKPTRVIMTLTFIMTDVRLSPCAVLNSEVAP